jgi:hypothetical protein
MIQCGAIGCSEPHALPHAKAYAYEAELLVSFRKDNPAS